MEPIVQEALRAKEYAEKHFAERDFSGARSYALKAQMMYPELEGISHMVATFGVYTASELRINGELDLYAILGLEPSADKGKVKKQYKKMAVLLHPDKNKSVGADGAFKLISEAWTVLSDHVKRSMYDRRINLSALLASGAGSFDNLPKAPVFRPRLDTFWTVCTSCHVQYEYLRKYINKRLSCKNCRGVFIAVETGAAPASGSYPYCPWRYTPENGYGGHGCEATYIPNNSSVHCPSNGVSGHHSGHGSEYISNVTMQWNSYPGTLAGAVDPNRFSTSAYANHQLSGKANIAKANGSLHTKKAAVDMVSNVYDWSNENPNSKLGQPAKKRKVDAGSGNEEVPVKNTSETRATNVHGNLKPNSKLCLPTETSTRRYYAGPAFDARQLLIEKARADIRRTLDKMRLVSDAEKRSRALAEVCKSGCTLKGSNSDSTPNLPEVKRTVSMSITVPDPDFHDFDKDRSEECFKPKQIWALYDEEDGMPRLYCLIRQVISVKPFKIYISYLSSKTDSEFGSVNWLDSGFTKSCGSFRVFNSEIVEQVNIFSHLLCRERAGRGGCVRIYPRSGDIWAVYSNWSPDWNRETPDEVRHQYEMVEVLDDYSEELGVCVAPLVKLYGYKTVYQRNSSKDAIRWVPRREMLRFSHQVPSCLLKGEAFNLPDDCWDLDPAAMPDELLQKATELLNDPATILQESSDGLEDTQTKKSAALLDFDEHAEITMGVHVVEHFQAENLNKSPVEPPLTGANVTV